jgi:hypothetical protein
MLLAAALVLPVVACSGSPPVSPRSADPQPRPSSSGIIGTPLVSPVPTDGSAFFVSPTGSDEAPGTSDAPWQTLSHALVQLAPGQTLLVRGGTYREQIRDIRIRPGEPTAPVVVRAAPGERPLVKGLLYLVRPSYWLIDGINVTWDDERNESDNHMVKLIDGVGWTWQNSELWGAASLSNILIVGNRQGEPADWTLRNNCIHDTIPTNDDSEDSNVYIGDMRRAGPGLVERNLIFRAANGRNIKLGAGSSEPDDGPTGVTVRYNTLYSAIVPIVVAGGARDIVIEHNVLGGGSSGYLIRGYKLVGPNVQARDNLGFDAEAFVAPDSGTLDAGAGNRLLPRSPLRSTTDCDAFALSSPLSAEYGHRAQGP